MKRIGKMFEYQVSSGTRIAKCTGIEFHQGIGKWLFTGISPFGNHLRLSKDEVRFINEK